MSASIGIYAIAPVRSSSAVFQFLARFAPEREEMTQQYEIPWSDDNPIVVFESDADLIAHCEAHPLEPYVLSWRRKGMGDPSYVRVRFTDDERLVLGLVVTSQAEKWQAELLQEVGGQRAIVCSEEHPLSALLNSEKTATYP